MAGNSNNRDDNARNSNRMTIVMLIIPYFGLFFLVWQQNGTVMNATLDSISSAYGKEFDPTASIISKDSSARQLSDSSAAAATSISISGGWDPSNPLAIPKGEGQAMPSIRVSAQESAQDKRKFYGGAGDKPHLGGFTEFDTDGVSPNAWKHMVSKYGIRSVMDVGCGRGTSTTWFLYHGLKIKCLEGSHDAVERTFLPDPATQVVEHDFARGPYWPADTYDAVWAVEFLEHVGVNFHFNYISAFRKAAMLFVTSSRWGGWHHVEVHDDDWWIRKYEMYGFRYSPELTNEIRDLARKESGIGPDGKKYRAQHIWTSMKVFINPAVASLPEHAHLFAGQGGCYVSRENGKIVNRECGTGKQEGLESKLPDSYKPLELTEEQDQAWMDMLKSKLNMEAMKDLV